MLPPRPLLLLSVLAGAQAAIPHPACDSRRAPPSPSPSPGSDPWANVPITETMTTGDGVRMGVQKTKPAGMHIHRVVLDGADPTRAADRIARIVPLQ